jgi:hypothetical protein
VGEWNDEHHERYSLLVDAQNAAAQCKEEHHPGHEKVFSGPEARDERREDVRQHLPLLHHGEGAPDEDEEQDDRDDREAVAAPEHLDGRREPPPRGVHRALNLAVGARHDEGAALVDRAVVSSRGNHAGEHARDHHEGEKDAEGPEEAPQTDLETRTLFPAHSSLLAVVLRITLR